MTVAPFTCQPVAAGAARRHVIGMAGKDNKRDQRLAAALRENLRKRKAQSRALPDTEGEGEKRDE